MAFSFKSEWIPAVAMVLMIKGKVSSHPLQNLTSCLKDKCICQRDANTNETDPKFESEDVPRGPKGEVKLAGGEDDNAEDGRS